MNTPGCILNPDIDSNDSSFLIEQQTFDGTLLLQYQIRYLIVSLEFLTNFRYSFNNPRKFICGCSEKNKFMLLVSVSKRQLGTSIRRLQVIYLLSHINPRKRYNTTTCLLEDVYRLILDYMSKEFNLERITNQIRFQNYSIDNS